MIRSRISAKAQTVLPVAVRQHLGVGPGDELVYEITAAGQVTVRAAPGERRDNPFVLFDEWESDADEDAYADLLIPGTDGGTDG